MSLNPGNDSRWRGRILRYAPIFLWIGVIFFLSSDQGSLTQTSRFVRPVLEFLFPGASEETLAFLHGIVRKSAHVSEYAVLAFLIVRAFGKSSVEALRKYVYLAPVALVVVVASMDEFQQSYNANRTGSAYDVLLDAAGAIGIIVFLWLISWPRRSSD